MFLTAYNLPHYLIARGIVSAESVVSGDFTLAEVGRRNRNFKILRRKHPGIFFKQIKTMEDQAITTLRREAAIYNAVQSNQQYAEIRGLMPKFVTFDDRRHALAVGLIENAESIAEKHMKEAVYREDTSHDLGMALARIHTVGFTMHTDSSLRTMFTYQMPWPLLLDQVGYSFLDRMGAIGSALAAGILDAPALQALLSALRAYWQYDSLIHGDMKWDNCMIKTSQHEPHLTIVDWELADIGDGAWDVAGVFKEYVMAIVLNGYQRELFKSQQLPVPPAVSMEELQPSVRAFWQAYSETRKLPNPPGYVDRAIRLTGARVVSAVLEYLYTSPQLGTLGTQMLHTSVNILQAPQLVASQLGLR